MFERVLVSVSDKTGLASFLRATCSANCEIVSTGGTAKFLRDEKFHVTEVSDVTGFPEMMDGRVRTLHPKIHMALLARSFVPQDAETLREYNVKAFDLVVVNLYPFEEAYKKNLKDQELIEKIDVGGPSMLRAAAKSFERLTVVCDPKDYEMVAEKVKAGRNDKVLRQFLAAKVFNHCGYYDALVGQALQSGLPDHSWQSSETLTLPLKKKAALRYGENPHQFAVWYETTKSEELSLSQGEILQGKELSYNNIVDLEAAVGAVSDFEAPACVIVKHATPCGVAIAENGEEAFAKAFAADAVSAFGGIVAINRHIDVGLASRLAQPFLECVIAPGVDPEALKILNAKKNFRVLSLAGLEINGQKSGQAGFEFKSLRGGALAQSTDGRCPWREDFKIIFPRGEDALTAHDKADLLFAQRVVRHIKSNAIVVVKNLQTLGICGGQTNRVDSVRLAFERARAKNQKATVLGSDAFFPFRDSIDIAVKEGVKWIIQPGGSLRDPEVEAAVREHGLGMVTTGTRHFKH